MTQKLLVANWKMNGNRESLKELANYYVKNLPKKSTEVVLCPSFPYLSDINDVISNTDIELGAQDCSTHLEGSYTGDISARMLSEVGCKYVIIGHSEHRKHHFENAEILTCKVYAAIESGLTPILCVGEELSIREKGTHLEYVQEDLEKMRVADIRQLVIAYEPVWAIGTGLTSSVTEVEEMLGMLKTIVKCPILYGGSVNSKNAESLSKAKGLDGFLVGNASLKGEEFKAIYEAL